MKRKRRRQEEAFGKGCRVIFFCETYRKYLAALLTLLCPLKNPVITNTANSKPKKYCRRDLGKELIIL